LLGKLSKSQIAKGFGILESIRDELKKTKLNKLNELSSQFWTTIPHAFGRNRPPVLDSEEKIQKVNKNTNIFYFFILF
jgi:poly [ADP-ribose] polymerase